MAGIETLRGRSAVLVIVDVLSFSTAVDVAVSRGAEIYPFPLGDMQAAEAAAERVAATLARPRRTAGGQFSLSPASLMSVPAGLKLMLPSPNGSRLSLAAGDIPVLAGCLRNAAAVARMARNLAGDHAIGVIPAGELWPDGSLRPAVEDLLGAGAIIHSLRLASSPEAQVALNAFRASEGEIGTLIGASISGRELSDAGFDGDVEIAVQLNVSACAPILRDGAYRAL